MHATYRFEPDNNLIAYTLSGPLTADGIMDVLNAAISDPDWSADYDMMCLFGDADFSAFTVDEAGRLSLAIQQLDTGRDETSPIRAALVSSDPLARGLLTFWEALGRRDRVATDRIFTTETEARAWLATPR